MILKPRFFLWVLAGASLCCTATFAAPVQPVNNPTVTNSNQATDRAARARIAELTAEIAKKPGEARLYFERGEEWRKVSVADAQGKITIGDLKQARADYEQALKLNPKYADARVSLAELQMSDAISQMKQAMLAAKPGSAYVEPPIVVTLNRELAQAQKDDPANFGAPYWTAILNLSLLGGLSEYAIQVLGKPFVIDQLTLGWQSAALAQKNFSFNAMPLLKLSPSSKEYLENLRKTATAEDWKRLQPILDAMTEALPRDYETWDLRASYRLKFKDAAGAQSDMEHALKHASDVPAEKKATLYVKMAQIKTANQDQDGAMADLNLATQLNPKDAAPYTARAGLHMSAGRREEALAELNTVLKKTTPTARIYQLRAAILRRLGRTAEAEADEKKAATLAP